MASCRGKLLRGRSIDAVRKLFSHRHCVPCSNPSIKAQHNHINSRRLSRSMLTDNAFVSALLDNSSQATTRPQYNSENSSAGPPSRPQFNRQISTLSTHSASGRPYPPPAPEGRTDVGKPSRPKAKGNFLLNRIAAQQVERQPNPIYSNGTQTSFNWRSGRPMAGMLELERSRTRRERTFIGSECAVCEEPLEHTLRGERILQFSCGHVSHEACFYEYIKEFDSQCCPTCNAPLGLDTSRGGNVLDLGIVFSHPIEYTSHTNRQ